MWAREVPVAWRTSRIHTALTALGAFEQSARAGTHEIQQINSALPSHSRRAGRRLFTARPLRGAARIDIVAAGHAADAQQDGGHVERRDPQCIARTSRPFPPSAGIDRWQELQVQDWR